MVECKRGIGACGCGSIFVNVIVLFFLNIVLFCCLWENNEGLRLKNVMKALFLAIVLFF